MKGNNFNNSQLFIFGIVFVLNIVGIFFLMKTHSNLKNCNNRESFNCPVYSCSKPDPDCGNAPFRCINLDAGSSTCSGANKMCMTYDVTSPVYKPKVTSTVSS